LFRSIIERFYIVYAVNYVYTVYRVYIVYHLIPLVCFFLFSLSNSFLKLLSNPFSLEILDMLSANSLNTSLKALKSLIRSFKNLLVDWYINLISSFKSPIWLFKEVFSSYKLLYLLTRSL